MTSARARPLTRLRSTTRVLSRRAREARKFAALGQLAPGIAHEINTPTQYIGDNLRFLRDAFEQLAAALMPDPAARATAPVDLLYLLEEIPSAIAQSLDGVAQVSHTVDAMRRFAAAPTGAAAPVDLNRAVESVVALARNEWKYTGEVVCDLDPALPLVPCAEGEVRQVVLSLVLGASRAVSRTGMTGRITVATRAVADGVELEVRDTGTAISLDGTSLGEAGGGSDRARELAFVHSVIAEHHGTVHAMLAGAEDTTVVVRLPVQRATPPNLLASAVEEEPT